MNAVRNKYLSNRALNDLGQIYLGPGNIGLKYHGVGELATKWKCFRWCISGQCEVVLWKNQRWKNLW
jgi:hypothetical protein